MGNYVRSGPFSNGVTPPGISAAFLNAIENVLEQPSGGAEAGKYWIGGWGNISTDILSQYMSSISRTAVPVSVTLDEADQAHSNCNAISSDHLTANGFHAYTSMTGAATSGNVGGNSTINF